MHEGLPALYRMGQKFKVNGLGFRYSLVQVKGTSANVVGDLTFFASCFLLQPPVTLLSDLRSSFSGAAVGKRWKNPVLRAEFHLGVVGIEPSLEMGKKF